MKLGKHKYKVGQKVKLVDFKFLNRYFLKAERLQDTHTVAVLIKYEPDHNLIGWNYYGLDTLPFLIPENYLRPLEKYEEVEE